MQKTTGSQNQLSGENRGLDEKILKNSEQISTLLELLQSQHEFTRWVAITALSEYHDPILFPQFIKALKDSSVSVRLAAAQALVSMNCFTGVSTLIQLLTEEEMVLGYPPMRTNKIARKVLEGFSGKNFGSLEYTDFAGKKRMMDQWADWWKKNHQQFESENFS